MSAGAQVYFILSTRPDYLGTGMAMQVSGLSPDLHVQIGQAYRLGHAHMEEMVDFRGWGANEEWEKSYATKPTIYTAPLNQLVDTRDLAEVYRTRVFNEQEWTVWDGPDVDTLKAWKAITDRNRHREAHMDADDPLRAVIAEEAKHLTPRPKDAGVLYVVSGGRRSRRTVGFFEDYRAAREVAREDATIVEVRADGCTPIGESKLVRGQFPGGWGYASGYAPTARVLTAAPEAGQEGAPTAVEKPAPKAKYPPKVSFYQDPEDTGRVRGAVRHTMATEGYRGLSDFIHLAVMEKVEQLEKKYNGGQPFRPAAARELPQGRPMGE